MHTLEEALSGFHDYISREFAPEDEALVASRERAIREGLPEVSISPGQGKLMQMLARLAGARRILELGTLGGTSAIWLARALPEGGKLVSLELDEHFARVARQSIEDAGLGDRVEIRALPAADALAGMNAAGEEPFDVIFIDADKDNYPSYLELCLPLLREGGLLMADNALPDAVLEDDAGTDAAPNGPKTYNAQIAAHPDLESIIVPVLRPLGEDVLRARGIDGLAISLKVSRLERETSEEHPLIH